MLKDGSGRRFLRISKLARRFQGELLTALEGPGIFLLLFRRPGLFSAWKLAVRIEECRMILSSIERQYSKIIRFLMNKVQKNLIIKASINHLLFF